MAWAAGVSEGRTARIVATRFAGLGLSFSVMRNPRDGDLRWRKRGVRSSATFAACAARRWRRGARSCGALAAGRPGGAAVLVH
ncbi:hypothetical protein Plo01_66960 [Planobispora longispora]|uniref:Uncharacterized protein n=1 Tax=Planobispora longispora TaxID=28887 RepID=A0A8J3W8Y4_9ACTN|nr:hypothetical protein Plo01_66960 [Planobispora longispora]